MASNTYTRKCASCGGTLKKNGKTSARTQRWRCTSCGASTIFKRPTRSTAWWARTWLAWLLTHTTINELGLSMRSFQRHTKTFWKTSPAPVFDGIVHDVLVIDATSIGAAMCHVIAAPPKERTQGRNRDKATVVAWGWAPTESAASWGALMARIPPPKVLVTDAQRGIAKAAAIYWPEARIQICTVHAVSNIHHKTQQRPNQFALRTARDLATMIHTIKTPRQASGWIELVHALDEALTPFLRQKTPGALEGGKRPWHYTHRKARSAWYSLRRHARTLDVFTWLDHELNTACDRPIPATTNDVEGGINAPLKDLGRKHRGLSNPRQRTLADWYLASRTENPPDPVTFLNAPTPNQPRHAHKDTLFGV